MAPEQDFVWSEGTERVSSYSRETGYKINFCSCCGSPVPNKFRDLPLYSIPLGTLDNEPIIKVVVQIYLGSKAKWEKEQLEGRQYVEMPPIEEMLAFLLYVETNNRSFKFVDTEPPYVFLWLLSLIGNKTG
jgi:hypothetical protein